MQRRSILVVSSLLQVPSLVSDWLISGSGQDRYQDQGIGHTRSAARFSFFGLLGFLPEQRLLAGESYAQIIVCLL